MACNVVARSSFSVGDGLRWEVPLSSYVLMTMDMVGWNEIELFIGGQYSAMWCRSQKGVLAVERAMAGECGLWSARNERKRRVAKMHPTREGWGAPKEDKISSCPTIVF